MALITNIRDILSITDSSDGDYTATFGNAFPAIDERWGNGTASHQADKWWADIGATVATGADVDLDLTSLANGPGGSTVVLAELRGFWIRSREANTTNLTVKGSGAANPFTAWGALLVAVKPGGRWRYVDPIDGHLPVSGGSKVIRITNASGATATYDVLIVGTSA